MLRKVKSLEWYNENKNKYGDIGVACIIFGMRCFWANMSKYCGKELNMVRLEKEDEFGVKAYKYEGEDVIFMEWMLELLELVSL